MTSRTHDNFRHNFWTWVDPPPVWTMFKKTALFLGEGIPKSEWQNAKEALSKLKNSRIVIKCLRKMLSDRRGFQGNREWESDGWSLFLLFIYGFWVSSISSLCLCAVSWFYSSILVTNSYFHLYISMISPSILYFSSNHISHIWGSHKQYF